MQVYKRTNLDRRHEINHAIQVCSYKTNQLLFLHKQPFLNISANITQILPDIYKTIRAIWPNFSCSSDNLKSARICSYGFHCLFVRFISTSAILVVVFWELCVNSAYSDSQSMSILWCSSANKDSILLSESVWEKHSQPNATNNKDSPMIWNFFAIFLISPAMPKHSRRDCDISLSIQTIRNHIRQFDRHILSSH